MYEKFLSPTRLTERIDLVGSQVKGRDRSSHGNDRRRRRFGQQLH
jgi:hypothetical protein